ncbi:MAG: antitoxin [Elusimicrobia bacterium RIFOXYB2_FULL_49_7]|nr:MAG: antitoxin [Elusimicrobia bacterium RIFOXYB2_FULL_49_7]
MIKLDKDEQDILDSYEKDEWRPIPAFEKTLKRHMEYAKASLHKNKRVNIRISSMDMELLKRRSAEEGIPCQTLMASVLHKFVSGRLRELAV